MKGLAELILRQGHHRAKALDSNLEKAIGEEIGNLIYNVSGLLYERYQIELSRDKDSPFGEALLSCVNMWFKR